LLERLVSIEPLPDDFDKLHPHSKKVIYVLGGSQKSLKRRLKTAAELYHKGEARNILILSRPGITEYDPLLGRNLTNDEWSVKRLEAHGVQKENIEPLSLKHGFFGTLAEAQGVSQEIMSKGYDVLILVSSSYHTARVQECFAKYLKDKKIKVFIYGSDDSSSQWGLMLEYFKLMLYKYILL
jgi:vancomycin permeability regulator SanA